MKILVLNCGSSSVKYRLFKMKEGEEVLAQGLIERIGAEGARILHRPSEGQVWEWYGDIPDHEKAIGLALEALASPEHGVISSVKDIKAVGHRVVHGGPRFSESVVMDNRVMEELRSCIELAPLHTHPHIMGIEACSLHLPGVPQVVVFDTAFHQTLPAYAYHYALPYELCRDYRVRKYGFHGTSHRFVAMEAARMLERPLKELKLITCHLGNGSSLAAIEGGRSVDTSMGFTPLEGVPMGTRSGDLDPAVVLYLQEKEEYTSEEMRDFLNKECGILGISGISSDFRDVEEAALRGDERAQLALDVFAYRVKKYVGAYVAVLNGIDALIFTAGLGENSPLMREKICRGLDYLGLKIDPEKNRIKRRKADISASSSLGKIMVIPTNEELLIARDTLRLVDSAPALDKQILAWV